MKDTFTANNLVIFSVISEHLESIIASYSVGEVISVIENTYHPPNSNNVNTSNILKSALTDSPNSTFYITGDFIYELFSIMYGILFVIYFTKVFFFANNEETK